jgi:hypothetical protein
VTVTAQVDEEQSMPLRELGGERKPVLRATAEAVQEHQRFSGSELLVIQLEVVDLNGAPANRAPLERVGPCHSSGLHIVRLAPDTAAHRRRLRALLALLVLARHVTLGKYRRLTLRRHRQDGPF